MEKKKDCEIIVEHSQRVSCFNCTHVLDWCLGCIDYCDWEPVDTPIEDTSIEGS